MRTLVGLICAAIVGFSLPTTAKAEELRIVGTGDGVDILRAVGELYTQRNPQTTIVVPPSVGSGGGILAVGSGQEILGRIARPLTDTEKAQGIVAVPFLKLPSAFYVHRSAGISSLTGAQLRAIFAGNIENWREVGGNDLRVRVVRREDRDSTLLVLRATMPGWDNLVITDKSKTAFTTQEGIESVRDVEGAIGWGPYSTSLPEQIVVLSVDGLFPTDEGYPSANTIELIYNEKTVTPEARDFLAFISSPEAREIVRRMGGVPTAK
ncbi:PstS family phosphate ABC transporter substrate-binding protein [Chelatococcus composti]|jgi:phosphate transport system substrate-binding protein|uniref:Phosphate transport system substrate-binding protein n=1 Tax=Chelatococcus composti TaxID=1743235 RepID=A0A841K5B6_9HYPH|nr:substrate-binding domain-containing protein [Chelatococcus composti]MBB6166682.1 phosphate transport system substrate-binding protein [Chelatococcus composti]MBS7734391.1 substrate-binding domain-containing protein [Chelatococcus composti]GGG26503.1 phosphate ABC transporter substrate-binding protein [Chelatococcus composti]